MICLIFIGFSAGIGIYQGCIGSKQLSAREFLVADGRMAVMQLNKNINMQNSYHLLLQVLPTAMSLLASVRSAASLLGIPVEYYYFGTMGFYSSTYQHFFYLHVKTCATIKCYSKIMPIILYCCLFLSVLCIYGNLYNGDSIYT
jgi:hypothetical protein